MFETDGSTVCYNEKGQVTIILQWVTKQQKKIHNNMFNV